MTATIGYFVCFILGLVGLLCSICLCVAQDIQRINHGMVFKYGGVVVLQNDGWRHTMRFRMPQTIEIKSLPVCASKIAEDISCVVASSLNEGRQKIHHDIKNIQSLLDNVIPDIQDRQAKRGLFDFVGSISKSLFGTATSEDVDSLRRHVNLMTRKFHELAETFAHNEGTMSSMITHVNDRMDNFEKFIGDTKAMEQDFLLTMITHQKEMLTNALAINYTSKIVELRMHLNNILDSIRSLSNGNLPTYLVKPDIIKDAIDEVTYKLEELYPRYSVAIKDVNYYYSHKNFIYGKNEEYLYITITFPITAHDPLKLYEIMTFAAPVDNETEHGSILNNQPDYVMLSDSEQIYAEVNNDYVMTRCREIRNGRICSTQISFNTYKKESCVMALYLKARNINEVCDYRYAYDIIKPNIIELNAKQVLLYNIDELNLHCNNASTKVPGCRYCIKEIPCLCVLKSKLKSYSGHISICEEDEDVNMKTIYPINVPLLNQFLNTSQIEKYLNNISQSEKVDVLIPKFKIYEHKVNSILANDKKEHLSLKRLAEKAKQNEKSYANVADAMLDGTVEIPDKWNSRDVIAIISIVLSGINSLTILYLIYRSRMLLAAYMLNAAHALQIEFKVPSTTPKYDLIQDIKETLEWDHVIFAVGIINFMLGIMTIYYFKMNQNSRLNYLKLHVTNGIECIDLGILKLDTCPDEWLFSVPTSMNLGDLKLWPVSKIEIILSGIMISNRITKQRLDIPNIVTINLYTALKLKKMMNSNYVLKLFLVHNGVKINLQAESGDQNTSNLYPRLY